jgi:hypothetical protein
MNLQDQIELLGVCMMMVCQMSTTAYDQDTVVREAKDLYRKLAGEEWPYNDQNPMSSAMRS